MFFFFFLKVTFNLKIFLEIAFNFKILFMGKHSCKGINHVLILATSSIEHKVHSEVWLVNFLQDFFNVYLLKAMEHWLAMKHTVMILSFRTDMPGQTVQTLIRLLLGEQSDQGLHCLPFCLHRLDSLSYGRAT